MNNITVIKPSPRGGLKQPKYYYTWLTCQCGKLKKKFRRDIDMEAMPGKLWCGECWEKK
jgi:hypothetical protein